MIPHALEESALLLRLKLLSVDLTGNMQLTHAGSRYLDSIAAPSMSTAAFDLVASFDLADQSPSSAVAAWVDPAEPAGKPS
jgi:hypothetical protein